MNITIERGGENIYVTPFAWHPENKRLNKVHYYDSPEFAPYPGEFQLGSDWYAEMLLGWQYPDNNHISLKRFWYLYLGRLISAFKKAFKLCRETKLWRRFLWIIKITLKTNRAFVAHEVYQGRFSIHGHMLINQKEEGYYTDDYYLTPSQWFLERELLAMLENDINKYDPIIDEDYKLFRRENALKYLDWRSKMLSRGFKIGYIASLDT